MQGICGRRGRQRLGIGCAVEYHIWYAAIVKYKRTCGGAYNNVGINTSSYAGDAACCEMHHSSIVKEPALGNVIVAGCGRGDLHAAYNEGNDTVAAHHGQGIDTFSICAL